MICNKEDVEYQVGRSIHFQRENPMLVKDDATQVIHIGFSNQNLAHAIASEMHFPYFGGNWNAFNDAISSLEWIEFESLFLVIHSAELWMKTQPEDVGDLIEIWQTAAFSWNKDKKQFHLIFVFSLGPDENRPLQ